MRFVLLAATLLAVTAQAQTLAPTPPMGWNSWDAYGTTIDEPHFRASAAWVAAHLKPFGYQFVAIDMEWFESDPIAEGNKKNAHYYLDATGRYLPDPARFPSSVEGAGFKPIGDYVHSLGLKFAIHVLQGIPKQAVAMNSPIDASTFHAKDAANTTGSCQWNPANYDLQDSSAGQAYYDSIVRLYASWGVDMIKIDCIAARPYKGDEVRMFHRAILNSGRPIVLSLSPGEAPLDETVNLQRYAQQWRISNDTWDLWHSKSEYPQGVNDQFPRAAAWIASQSQDKNGGHWPDADMLPLGSFPAPGWGKPRSTNLTHDEQRTLINLWCIMRSPLMYGGDPVATDDWTLSLLTNRGVLDVDQHSTSNKSILLTDALAIWTADTTAESLSTQGHYLAIFNRQDTPQTVTRTLAELGFGKGKHVVSDLWTHEQKQEQSAVTVTLAPHASALYFVGDNPRLLPKD